MRIETKIIAASEVLTAGALLLCGCAVVNSHGASPFLDADVTDSGVSDGTVGDSRVTDSGDENLCETLGSDACTANPDCMPLKSLTQQFFGCIKDPGCGQSESCTTNGTINVAFPTDCIPDGWDRLPLRDCVESQPDAG